MKSHYLRSKTGRILLALFFLAGIGMVSTASAQTWPYGQDPYRRDRRDDRSGRGGYGNEYQIAANQGYQDGLYTGSNDAQRRQSYNPQRSHYYRNASSQAFRDGFLRGYDEGFRRYGGYRGGGYSRSRSGSVLGGIFGRP